MQECMQRQRGVVAGARGIEAAKQQAGGPGHVAECENV